MTTPDPERPLESHPTSGDTGRHPPSEPEQSRERAGTVSGEAMTAALLAYVDEADRLPRHATWPYPSSAQVRVVLEAATPFILAAERERIRSGLRDAIEAALGSTADRRTVDAAVNAVLAIIGGESP